MGSVGKMVRSRSWALSLTDLLIGWSRSLSSLCRIRSGGRASSAYSTATRSLRLLRTHAASDPISVAARISPSHTGVISTFSGGAKSSGGVLPSGGGLFRSRSSAAARFRSARRRSSCESRRSPARRAARPQRMSATSERNHDGANPGCPARAALRCRWLIVSHILPSSCARSKSQGAWPTP